jgi:hypothetical protein
MAKQKNVTPPKDGKGDNGKKPNTDKAQKKSPQETGKGKTTTPKKN